MKSNLKNSNLPRIVIQWTFIVAVVILAALPFFKDDYTPDFEAYCPFGGIQALSSFLLNGSLACTMTSAQIAMGVMLMIGVVLFSKLFCSYICPIGTISEWLGKLGEKIKVRITLSGLTDTLMRSLKYLLLFITFYFTLGSNELFCKKYDPYYAIASGFSMDVVLLYASLAIAIVIIGSVFIRLLWCKYLCPLGAISNLFKFAWFFLAVILIYIVLIKLNFTIHFAWPLGILCLGGYILEIWGTRLLFIPVARITRNETTCTDCQLCSRKCPQAIDVASMKVVNHIDCNLCSECITVCPVKETIQINHSNKLRWLPPIAVLVLIVVGFFLSTVWELPTIDQKWYDSNEMKKAEVFTQSGLKNVKCYGSSMAFAAKMKEVPGVMGVATFVTTHTVKVYFDPAVTNKLKLQSELFTPMKTPIRLLDKGIEEVKVVSLLLDNFFDPMDFTYLSILLKEKTTAIGLESEFNCPVQIRIYFPGNSDIKEENLIKELESDQLAVESGGKKKNIAISYKVVNKLQFSTISKGDYVRKMFQPIVKEFNNIANYSTSLLDTMVVPLGTNKYNTKALPYLISHLSNDDGVVGFKSALDTIQQINFEIIYVDTLTNPTKIWNSLKCDSLSITFSTGEKEKMANMFKF
ncbi:MAG: 4Fe-4S binding protein [Prolixibacteraceae bacterium]